jgi:UDP-3-O-[3-hydroxymyristoyl] glucosamine N-acyltransferase
MISQKIFLKMKSPGVADSWLMRTSVMQYIMKYSIRIFNVLAPRTGLFQRVRAGSLGPGNEIDPTAIIDYPRVIIGAGCKIGKMVVIEKNTIIGSNVTIGEFSVIGSEGFELRRLSGEIVPVAHLGGVIIHDNVTLGPRVCIDKSSLGEYTEIGENSVIREGVEVGHGIRIGRNVTVMEGTMIGGNAIIGNNVKIGRRCSTADGLSFGDNVVIPDHAVVTRDMESPVRVAPSDG